METVSVDYDNAADSQSGRFELRDVIEAFDADYYRKRYSDIRQIDPFYHFCYHGWKEGRDPNEWFSTRLYLLAHLDVAASHINPFIHYILRGRGQGYEVFKALVPTSSNFVFIPEAELIRGAFDPLFYRQQYLDVGDMDPLQHYCVHGWREHRDPCPWFSTSVYLANHPDVEKAAVNPFIHYVFIGHNEGRSLRPNVKPRVQSFRQELEVARTDSRGVLTVGGWALSLAPIERVAILLDDEFIGDAEHGLSRKDVETTHPEYPDAGMSGYRFVQEITGDISQKMATVRIVTLGGVTRQFSTQLQVTPVIRRQKAESGFKHRVDEISLADDGTLTINGWAFSGSDVQEVTISLDGREVGVAEAMLARPDVGNHFPLARSARNSGFRFVGKVAGKFTGEHTVEIMLRNQAGETKIVLLPVLARPAAVDLRDEHVIEFNVDSPELVDGRAVAPVTGELLISGWAVASNGIAKIEVFVDGVYQGAAHSGSRRPDVKAAFPAIPDAGRSGYTMAIPAAWNLGTHQVKIVVRDRGGNVRDAEFAFEAAPLTEAGFELIRHKVKRAETDIHVAICDALNWHPAFTLISHLRTGSPREIRKMRLTIDSLRRQTYGDWRFIIVCRTAKEAIGELSATDPRIVVSNDVHEVSSSVGGVDATFVGLLRAGDEIGADALLEMSVSTGLKPAVDLFYSDERRTDQATGRVSAFFKPDWSPDLLLGTNYVGRLWFVRSSLLCKISGWLRALLAFGEYDLLLRLTDDPLLSVHHVQRVLCNTSSDRSDTQRQEADALQRTLRRRRIHGQVVANAVGSFRVKRAIETTALVSIIIPTIAAKGLIRGIINSIREKTAYKNFEIICIDGIPDTDIDSKTWLRSNADKLVKAPKKFNWSRCNNLGAARASGEYLVFLNDDMEIVEPYWLHALLEHAQRPDVGAVGPLLLYPNGRVQHAGIVLSRGAGIHVFRGAEAKNPGAFGLMHAQRNVIGVTGACMMVRRDVFHRLGKFDEAHSVINNDLDFCLRCHAAGLKVLYTPHTHLTHFEESSRATIEDRYDAPRFNATWANLISTGDPFSHPNVTFVNGEWRTTTEPTEVLHVGHPITVAADIKRILIVKLDHIGDFIIATPAIDRLKAHFPQAEITALVGKQCAALAKMLPSITKVIEFNFFHERSGKGRLHVSRRALTELYHQLKPHQFDLAIDLRQQPDTREVLRYTGSQWCAGYDRRNMFPWLDVFLEITPDDKMVAKRTHGSDILLQLVEAVAIACHPTRTVLAGQTPAMARQAMASHPAFNGLADLVFGAPLVCMQPGGGAAIKRWPSEHFASVADLLIERLGANVILIGSPDEQDIATKLLASANHTQRIFSLIGMTNMGDLPQILQCSDMMIGNNSGPHHLAAALGVPTIGIHAGFIDGNEYGPLGPLAVTIGRRMHCSPCYLEKIEECHRGHACMQGLLPRQVYDVCERLLTLRAASPINVADRT